MGVVRGVPTSAPLPTILIRRAEVKDHASILSLARSVEATGDSFPWEARQHGKAPKTGDEEQTAVLAETWLPEPGKRRDVFVCEVEDFAGIAGVYVLQPKGTGRCGHIAAGAYMVAPDIRGQGLGKKLCMHSLRQAQEQRYTGMQFDMVVATNTAAIKAWTSCGFKIMCTLPRVFRHPEAGFVDAHVMFHDFSDKRIEALETHTASESLASELQHTFGYEAAERNFVGDEVNLHPQPLESAVPSPLSSGIHARFKVEPPLPEGLSLCPNTGTIHGSPLRPCPAATYHITAEANAEVKLQVLDTAPPRVSQVCMYIDEAFAARVETIVDVAAMPREPPRIRAFGDWMIWMVHRAWLNDPTLVDFNFDCMHMPAPHLEPRIATKLMEALQTNTYIEVLSLSNSNMQKSTALELAAALRENSALRTVNLEANCLDSASVRDIALSVRDSSVSRLEHLRLQHQRQMGTVFGRPTEEAVGQMMQRNETIVKLGFECSDAHWRNSIDRALVRNNDFRRRREQSSSVIEEEATPAEERTLGQLALEACPAVAANELFCDGSEPHALLRAYLAQNLQLPTTPQLQQFAKNSGASLSYAVAAPLLRQCRSWILNEALSSEVLVVDAFGMTTMGTLTACQENGERWTLDVCAEEDLRLCFKSHKEPAIFLSDQWTSWLNMTQPPVGSGA